MKRPHTLPGVEPTSHTNMVSMPTRNSSKSTSQDMHKLPHKKKIC